MAFTKINAAGIGTTETVTVDGLTVINDGSFGGNLSVGGTITYEDVTNVDSVGIITARAGVLVGSGITLSKDGDVFATGVTTTGSLVSSGAISGTTGTFSDTISIADNLQHVGDTDTQIRFPAADTITAETGGSERVRITSTGLVGVGINNPARILHLHEASSDTVQLHITNSTTGTSGSDGVSFALGSDESLIINQRESNHISLKTADTERLRIDSSGQLGIGIASPSSLLHAYHATTNTIAQFQSGDAGAGILLKDNTHYTRLESTNGTFKIDVDAGSQIGSEIISFQISNSEKVRIDSSGNFGIGTISPAYNLDISNSSGEAQLRIDSSAGNHGMIRFSQAGTNKSYIQHVNGNHLAFGPGGSEKLRISSAGDVTVADGDLIFGANGNALDFQNQTIESTSSYNRTITAEKMDYYEEGYLDPTAVSAGLTWDASNNRQLRYVRIGNWVSVSGLLLVSSRTSNSTAIRVAMPFTSASQTSEGYYTRGVGAVMYQYVTLSANMDDVVAYVGGNENYMRFFQTRNDGGGWTELENQNLDNSSNCQIYFSINYMVA